jgi:hypothetical protein
MSDERREALVNAGQQAMRAYLADSSTISAVSFGTDVSSKTVPLDHDAERLADKIATRLLR